MQRKSRDHPSTALVTNDRLPVGGKQMTMLSLDDVRTAQAELRGVAVRTPLLQAFAEGRPLWLKAENLQVSGSFKFRGAFVRMSHAVREGGAEEVVAHSSGNHAQAVARSAQLLGVSATVFLPDTATAHKLAATRELGANVVTAPADAYRALAVAFADERGAPLISPFDDLLVMAGQGTVGLEVVEDLSQRTAPLTEEFTLLVPVGSGGLLAGVAVAAKALHPRCRVVGIEPELAADAAESLRVGRRVGWDVARTGRTIADGLRTPMLGERTWGHIERYVDDIVTVSDEEIRASLGFLADRAHLVAEPSGAVATAAFLYASDRIPGSGPFVAVVSGGNVAPTSLGALLTEPKAPEPHGERAALAQASGR